MGISWLLNFITFSFAGAFVPVALRITRSDHGQLFMMQNQDREMSRRGLIHFFGIGAWWMSLQQDSLAATSASPSATGTATPTNPFDSSSVQVSDAIKTLDMSMPSYGDIKAPTASVENVDGLTVPYNPRPGGGQSQEGFGKKKKNPYRKPLVLRFPGSGNDKAENDKGSMSYNF